MQTIKHPLAVWIYVNKQDKSPAVYGCDPSDEVDAREQHRRTFCKEILKGTKTVEDLILERPEQLVHYAQLKKSVDAYQLNTMKPKARSGVCGIWVHGPPNSGKTHWVKHTAMERYGEEPFIITAQNGSIWFDGYRG